VKFYSECCVTDCLTTTTLLNRWKNVEYSFYVNVQQTKVNRILSFYSTKTLHYRTLFVTNQNNILSIQTENEFLFYFRYFLYLTDQFIVQSSTLYLISKNKIYSIQYLRIKYTFITNFSKEQLKK